MASVRAAGLSVSSSTRKTSGTSTGSGRRRLAPLTTPPVPTATLLAALHASDATPEKQPLGKQAILASKKGASSTGSGSAASGELGAINRSGFSGGWKEGSPQMHFTWGEDDALGQGSFGSVFRGRCKYQSNRVVAVKQILRSAVDDVDQLWAEIRILSELDHPSILRFLEAYHDAKHVYVVTEVCQGGSLDDWLPCVVGDVGFASRVVREISGALAYCHSKLVCHRDLKLENVLLVRESRDSPVRISDFGLAKRCSRRVQTQRLRWHEARAFQEAMAEDANAGARGAGLAPIRTPGRSATAAAGSRGLAPVRAPGRSATDFVATDGDRKQQQPSLVRMTSFKGTPEYMAPEVIRILHLQLRPGFSAVEAKSESGYDFRCDVWSLGCVAHMLLTGDLPYSVEEISAFVAEGMALPEKFGSAETSGEGELDADAEDFIRICLHTDFQQRPSAEDLLAHHWLASSVSPVSPSASQSRASDLARRLHKYCHLSRFKQAALTAAVRHLGAFEHEQMRALFQEVDTDNSGRVSTEKLCEVLRKAAAAGAFGADDGVNIEDLEARARAIDSDHSGEIEYTEFLAAVMDKGLEDRRDLAMAAFRSFDLDGDGMLTKKELSYVFECLNITEEALRLGDDNGDGELSFEEFLGLLRRG